MAFSDDQIQDSLYFIEMYRASLWFLIFCVTINTSKKLKNPKKLDLNPVVFELSNHNDGSNNINRQSLS